MQDKKVLFTTKEINLLSIYDTLDKLKGQRNFYFIISLVTFFWIFFGMFNVIKLINLLELPSEIIIIENIITYLVSAIFFILILGIVFSYIKQYIKYSKLYKKCKSLDVSPFVHICNEKIDKCRNLLESKENSFEIDYWYSELKVFVNIHYNQIFDNEDSDTLHEKIDEIDAIYEELKTN